MQDWIASLQRGGKFLFTRRHNPFRQGEVQPGDLANEYTYGLEFQLMDDSNEDGPKPDQKTGALYGRIAPDEQLKRFTIGEWNRARLVVSERRVEHWINGKRVLSRIPGMIRAFMGCSSNRKEVRSCCNTITRRSGFEIFA